MLYKQVNKDLNFKDRELAVLDFWKQNRIFEKTTEKNKGKAPYTFYDGPPTANGKPHIGHILTRCIKDLIPRYKTMQGFDVLRKAGWDTHGLPVELEVEKLLGLDGKDQIEQYGVEPFIAECKKSVWTYKGEWERMSDRVGFWADMQDPYITYENKYIESVWWSLKVIHEKGLLYKGHKIVPFCPRCGTALSSHEVAQGYKDVKETSIFVKFKAKDDPDTYFMAWTTTPWTLPSNVALCVNPQEVYAKVRHNGENIIIAKSLIETVLDDGKIIEEYTGKDLEFKEYEPLYDFGEADKKAWYITADEFVTLSDGSGIVHIAPAFGEDDARVGKNYDLPFVQMVNEKGQFKKGTPWEDVFVKKADADIINDLDNRKLLFAAREYEHSYPYCWRCDTPLLYYARSTWFIKMTAVKELLQKNNRAVNWLPDNIKEGRMGNFLENVIDWGLSRERYWGTPLPVWECGCGHFTVIGSVKELCEKGNNVTADIELHKPFIDRVTVKCGKCGGEMKRVSEVIDCWYDSGSMPFAQWHYPFENAEEFKKRFPADFISEAVDQTRGWFYTLLAIGTLVFGTNPFENCIVLGHVQDKDGQKMSKHKGNVIDPWTVLDSQGADAVRWYFYSNSAPWLPNRFYEEAVSEAQRKFMGTLWNTYAFYVMYADIDDFNPNEHRLGSCNVMDKWILSRLSSLVKNVCRHLDDYKLTEPAREMDKFVDELSNWYVRRCRDRFWASGMGQDKVNAFMTLYTVLKTLCALAAPFTPFMTETMYQNIVRSVDNTAPESVHLCSYPQADETLIDNALEENMDKVLKVVVLGRSARNTAGIKNRQPISNMYVAGIDALDETYTALIAGELNIKKVTFGADASAFISYDIKPQLKTLGPKYGKLIAAIRNHLAQGDAINIVNTVRSNGVYTFETDGQTVALREDDMLIEPTNKEGYVTESYGGISVILETTLSAALIEEGFVREMISKIQTMRKEAGFEVTDHIRLALSGNDNLRGVIKRNADEICKEVLADEIADTLLGYEKQWDINGEKAAFSVKKIR
ncbi:MAG: isoleucine--tRNA ligase [Christensenellales bacterium]|jgi:isoleucyl-tRNA synthetase